MSGGLYSGAARVIAVAMIVLGLVIVVRTIDLGGGPLSFGFIVGLVLAAIGSARLWLALKLGGRTK